MLFTVDRYHAMIEKGIITKDDKVELIGGRIVEMNPSGSVHAAVISRIEHFFIKNRHDSFWVRGQLPVTLGEKSEPEPDILIVPYREDEYIDRHPTEADALLLIEVSDSSYPDDKRDKTALYASHRIPEFWIVNIAQEVVEVYRDPADGQYSSLETRKPGDSLTPLNIPGFLISVDDCFPKRK